MSVSEPSRRSFGANAVSVKILVQRSLSERAARLLHQIRLDEAVEVAVEHAIDVADRFLRPVILHELIRVQHVAANLAAEGDLLLRAADLIELRLLFLLLQIVEARLEHL